LWCDRGFSKGEKTMNTVIRLLTKTGHSPK
jgi:hypothetical protein